MLTIGTISAGFAFHAWLNVTHGTQVVSPANIPALNAHMITTTDAAGTISRTAALTGPCPGLTTMTGDYVQSTVSRPVAFNYVLGSADISVASTSVSRFEAVSLS